MKKVTKILIIVFLVIVLAAILTIGTIALINNSNISNLSTMVDIFNNTIKKEINGDVIEIKSIYGKLNGNGNGIQYFGSALVEKSSIENLDQLLAELDSKFEIVEILEQKDNLINSKYLQNKSLNYDFKIRPEIEYISICFFNSNYPGSDYQNILGH